MGMRRRAALGVGWFCPPRSRGSSAGRARRSLGRRPCGEGMDVGVRLGNLYAWCRPKCSATGLRSQRGGGLGTDRPTCAGLCGRADSRARPSSSSLPYESGAGRARRSLGRRPGGEGMDVGVRLGNLYAWCQPKCSALGLRPQRGGGLGTDRPTCAGFRGGAAL